MKLTRHDTMQLFCKHSVWMFPSPPSSSDDLWNLERIFFFLYRKFACNNKRIDEEGKSKSETAYCVYNKRSFFRYWEIAHSSHTIKWFNCSLHREWDRDVMNKVNYLTQFVLLLLLFYVHSSSKKSHSWCAHSLVFS